MSLSNACTPCFSVAVALFSLSALAATPAETL